MADQPFAWHKRLLWWVLYSVAWVSASGLTLWLTMQLRINLIDLNNFFGWGPWILIGVDKFGWVLLVLAWLIGVFVIEMYLRAAATLSQLLRRTAYVLVPAATALGFSYLLQRLLV
ncbi:MAG: hypothetical protein R3C14_10290 [Caldilineaceae bacterium]